VRSRSSQWEATWTAIRVGRGVQNVILGVREGGGVLPGEIDQGRSTGLLHGLSGGVFFGPKSAEYVLLI
jgi:hypothetical protein